LRALLKKLDVGHPQLRKVFLEEFPSLERMQEANNSKEIIRCLRIQNKKLLQELSHVRTRLKQESEDTGRLKNIAGYLTKLNQALSGALGSCPTCWGEDPNCTACEGNGMPGWRNINKRSFNIYVLPCLEKLYGLNSQ
jgi:hypothetical protein